MSLFQVFQQLPELPLGSILGLRGDPVPSNLSQATLCSLSPPLPGVTAIQYTFKKASKQSKNNPKKPPTQQHHSDTTTLGNPSAYDEIFR